jgi:hypothetical protein
MATINCITYQGLFTDPTLPSGVGPAGAHVLCFGQNVLDPSFWELTLRNEIFYTPLILFCQKKHRVFLLQERVSECTGWNCMRERGRREQ